MRYQFLAGCSFAAAATMLCAPAIAQTAERKAVHMAAQPMSASLQQLGTLFGRNVSVDQAVLANGMARALDGEFTFEEAVAAVLAGSGLRATPKAGGVVVRRAAQQDVGGDDIMVTGSRIRGAPIASTTLTYEKDAMRDAGQSSASDVIRAIPQNFSGGQNPGIGSNVSNGKSIDVGGGVSLNLRGLGSDATLTLLDGRRLSFDAALQGVDISAIPFGAIERIEVVPDGSSALFGSDAVAGVANIILRRDFDGLETSARLAGSTDGGNFQQLYGATVGKVWGSGSAMLSYEYASNTGIKSEDRSYLRNTSPGLEVYPKMRHHNAALVLRQDIAPGLTLDFDGIYNNRRRYQVMPLNAAGDLSESRYDTFANTQSWAVAPSLKLAMPADWQLSLAGSYGWSKVFYGGILTYGSDSSSAGEGFYRNATANVELSGNGKLIDLPAGAIKAALGAGYRNDQFHRETTNGASQFVDKSRDSYYAFGEISIPVISADQHSPLGRSLDLSAAARYERYAHIASVATPKLGVIFAPSSDVTLKGSWGKSFRAATFYEQYTANPGYLEKSSNYGGTTGTVLSIQGGNPDLKPERSTNWSTTLLVHPAALRGAELEISYFDIRYRNRIVTPITYTRQALTNPQYADYVTLNPDVAAQNDVIDRMITLTNLTSSAYDPSTVVAIVDNSNVNAGRQRIHGIDVLARYAFDLGGGRLSTSVNGSYLESKQQLGPDQAFTQLAGTLFNPPHWRGRGEIGWAKDGLTLTGAINYIGPVRDVRYTPALKVDGMVPIDFTIRYRPKAEHGLLGGIDVIASVQNAFNDKPDTILTTSFLYTPYDSTNYSPFGRVVSLTVSKKW